MYYGYQATPLSLDSDLDLVDVGGWPASVADSLGLTSVWSEMAVLKRHLIIQ